MSNISIVIGSWGSYNECNERALGSKWLDLGDFDSWEEIEEELTKQGFELDGLDEELFIQDIDGISTNGLNCDYTHPKDLFELLQEADVISNDYNYEIMSAFLEVRTFDDFKIRVESCGSNWNDDIYLYKNKDWYDLGYDFMHDCYQIPSYLDNYIDYERYANDLKYDGFEEYSEGIIEIR